MSVAARPVVDSPAFLHCGTDDVVIGTTHLLAFGDAGSSEAVQHTLLCWSWCQAGVGAQTSPSHVQDTKPITIRESYKGADKLKGKVAIITGASSMPWGVHCLGASGVCGVLGFQSLQRHCI